MSLRLLVSAEGDPQARVFRYDFDGDRAQILLGRRGGVDVLLPHAAVSLVHARIDRRGEGYQIVDDRSTNGTFLNGVRLDPGQPRPLQQGDKLSIGEFALEVAALDEGDEPAGESSISIARRMVAEVMGVLGPGDEHPTLAVEPGSDVPLPAALAIAEIGRRYIVGGAPGADLVLAHPSVAREHVRVRRDHRGVTVADLGSTCGLYVNDQFTAAERGLRDGDVLAVGKVRLRFADPAEVYLRKLEQVPTPSEGGRRTAQTAAPSSGKRGEGLVIAVAAVVALCAAIGLVYLWAS
ncbi:MAG: FHA domain-containing protein [Myxococcales bacterium]|nr:FHA domain-containing protein [Myxococcales bacterium]